MRQEDLVDKALDFFLTFKSGKLFLGRAICSSFLRMFVLF